MAYILRSARYIAADALRQVVRPGDRVIDATLGNGHDTRMLAELVGETGRVIGFDIQQEAVDRTEASLREAGLLGRCELHAVGHQHIAERVTGPIRAAVFNLGWLPGGDKAITTRWETTHAALSGVIGLLEPGGICTVCAYPGHAAGDEERRALTDWLSALRPQAFNVLHHRFLNAGPGAPECFIIQKNPDLREG
ncbi:MAG: class I SAM-dependent methyltransferase [Christensenellaceae bacterium]|nr:class I SAM-dependent methyltransferase [Christensenellaceae bacterium]